MDIEEKPPFDDYRPSRDKHRVAIRLIYAPDSLGRNDWMALIDREVNNFELSAKK